MGRYLWSFEGLSKGFNFLWNAGETDPDKINIFLNFPG